MIAILKGGGLQLRAQRLVPLTLILKPKRTLTLTLTLIVTLSLTFIHSTHNDVLLSCVAHFGPRKVQGLEQLDRCSLNAKHYSVSRGQRCRCVVRVAFLLVQKQLVRKG